MTVRDHSHQYKIALALVLLRREGSQCKMEALEKAVEAHIVASFVRYDQYSLEIFSNKVRDLIHELQIMYRRTGKEEYGRVIDQFNDIDELIFCVMRYTSHCRWKLMGTEALDDYFKDAVAFLSLLVEADGYQSS